MKKKIVLGVIIVLIIPLVIFFGFPEVILGLKIKSARSHASLVQKSLLVKNNLTVSYLEGGKGDTVILLHGLGGNKDNWPDFAKSITPSFHVIALDLPGSGESTKVTTEIYNIAAQMERLDEIVKALKIDKFHLVGHGMGGAIAMKYSATFGNKILSLALIDTDGIKSPEQSDFDKEVQKGNNPLGVKNVADFENLLKFMFVTPPSIPGPIKRYMTNASLRDSDFNQKIFWDAYGEDYSAEKDLPKITAKTLILWGDTDRRFSVSAVSVLRKGITKSRAVIMKNCGHFPMREMPNETAKEYLAFLKTP